MNPMQTAYWNQPEAVAQAGDIHSFRSYVAAAAMLRNLTASLDGSRVEGKRLPSRSQ